MTHDQKQPQKDLLRLKTQLKKEQARLEFRLKELQKSDESSINALWMKQIADSLEALEHTESEKGIRFVSLTNIHTGIKEKIQLNPKLDTRGNAALFRKKAVKILKKTECTQQKSCALAQKIKMITSILSDIEVFDIETTNSNDIQNELEEIQLKVASITGEKKNHLQHPNKKYPYRHFSFQGWDIFAGKSDEQNDELSLRFTSPRDLWFHAAHCPGSHVVVKGPTPEQYIIEKAAIVAAWFSKSKNAPTVMVHYTEGRYVHKRRNAPKGEVILEKFSTIKVAPQDPENLFSL